MPNKLELSVRLSDDAKQGIKGRSFSSEAELRAFLRSATFDGGRIHRYVESRSAEGAGMVADLQRCIEQVPESLLSCLRGIARMERSEKRALKSYLHTVPSLKEIEAMLQAIQAIPETPLFEDVPRFTLPGWEEPGAPT